MQITEQDVRTSDCHPSHNWDDNYLDSLPYYITSVDLTWSSWPLVKWRAMGWTDKDCVTNESHQVVYRILECILADIAEELVWIFCRNEALLYMNGIGYYMLWGKISSLQRHWTDSERTRVLRRNSMQAATNIRQATSADLRWYVRDHSVIPNKNVEMPCW